MPNEQEMRKHRCCFTGHRPEKLSQNDDEVRQWLTERIASAVSDGFVTFITGMAMGVDIWAGEIVLRLREEDSSLHLIAAVPWPGFSARWNAEWKERYDRLLVTSQERKELYLLLPMQEKRLERMLARAGFESSEDYTVCSCMSLPSEVQEIIKNHEDQLLEINRLCNAAKPMKGRPCPIYQPAV